MKLESSRKIKIKLLSLLPVVLLLRNGYKSPTSCPPPLLDHLQCKHSQRVVLCRRRRDSRYESDLHFLMDVRDGRADKVWWEEGRKKVSDGRKSKQTKPDRSFQSDFLNVSFVLPCPAMRHFLVGIGEERQKVNGTFSTEGRRRRMEKNWKAMVMIFSYHSLRTFEDGRKRRIGEGEHVRVVKIHVRGE